MGSINRITVMFEQPDLTTMLRSIPFFLELSPRSLEPLEEISQLRLVPAGETLFQEGDRESELYILLEGQVQLTAHIPNHGEFDVFTAEPLDIIGWSALTPIVRQRTASAVALKDSILLALDGDGLRALCEADHDLGYIFMRRISNIVASRLLATRLQLYDLILQQPLPHS